MDFNALQHKLFALDPTDPAEDMRKLAESASRAQESAGSDVNYVQESVEVTEGSLGLDKDYSIADFATLAGVTLNESQKTGSAGQAKGRDPMPKAKPGRTEHPLKDKLVGEDNLDEISAKDALKRGWDNYNTPAALGIENPLGKVFDKKPTAKKASTKPAASGNRWRDFLKQHTATLQQIAANPKKKAEFDMFMSKMSEDTNEQEIDEILPALGAMAGRAVAGAVANKAVDKLTASKKKKPIKSKIDPTTESIKEMLYRKLKDK